MARIAGIDLPREKRVEIALTYIFGIGRKSANDILKLANVNPDTRVKDLTEDQEAALRDVIDKNYTIEGDLRREVALNIKRLTEIRLLPRHAPQKRPAGQRSAHQDQRAHPQGPEEDHCE